MVLLIAKMLNKNMIKLDDNIKENLCEFLKSLL